MIELVMEYKGNVMENWFGDDLRYVQTSETACLGIDAIIDMIKTTGTMLMMMSYDQAFTLICIDILQKVNSMKA